MISSLLLEKLAKRVGSELKVLCVLVERFESEEGVIKNV